MMFDICRKNQVLVRELEGQWLTAIILATWEAEIGRIVDQGQPGQIVCKSSISKITRAKWTGGEVWLKW
jgi:hypothetical protein